jgi:hypothetical protein
MATNAVAANALAANAVAANAVAANAVAANAVAANAVAANALAANAPTAKPELNLSNLNELNSKGKPKHFRWPQPHPFMGQANVGRKRNHAINTRAGPGFAPDRMRAGVYKLYEGPIKVGDTFRLNNNLGVNITFMEVNPILGGEILYEANEPFEESEIYRESERGEGKKWTVYKRMVAGGSSKKRSSKKRSLKKHSLKRKITHRKK